MGYLNTLVEVRSSTGEDDECSHQEALAWGTVVLVLISASCSKHKLGLGAGDGLFVIASGSLMNSVLGQETILRAELLFDGKVINTVDCSPACGTATLVGMKESVKPGRHTVAFRIASQSSSPNAYETVAVEVQSDESRFELGNVPRLLATGEAISYTIELNR